MDMNINGNNFFDRFRIGTYYLQHYARTESHISDLRNSGIDFVIGVDNDHKMLDLFYKHGVHAIVTGVVPGWFGGNGDNAGTMRTKNKKEGYVTGKASFRDHPAIVGIDLGDEPSSADFLYYGEVVKLCRDLFPNKLLYLNIYPSYGMLADSRQLQIKKELGKDTYDEYLKAYCEHIELPYLCFDHYVYSSDEGRFLSDLLCAASCCREYGKKLCVVLQVNSQNKDQFLSLNQLRFQAFSALAFGVSSISWACYTAGWWHNQVLDEEGNKTEQFEKLKEVNRELRMLTKMYSQYHWVHTERISFETPVSYGVFEDIRPVVHGLLGYFENGEHQGALLYVPLERSEGGNNKLTFKTKGQKRVCIQTTDRSEEILPSPDNSYMIEMPTHDACFVTLI